MTVRVLSIASEAVPLVKTGGLADVVGALPAALAPHDVAITTLLPGYPAVLNSLDQAARVHEWPDLLGRPAALLAGRLGAFPLLVLDCPALYCRDGRPYTDATGRDWPDNWRRFAALARAGADLATGGVPGQAFDLAHAHDWQAGLTPAYIRYAPAAAPVPSVMTIHNMAFQGHFGAAIFPELGLPAHAFAIDGVEYHGGVSLLKAGLESASAITTVSPTYAVEIREPAYGMGLEGLIRSHADRVYGIVNGIDPAEWSPETDALLASRYSWRSLGRRAANKRALEREFGLEQDDGPLFVVISRLTWQKGIDVVLEVVDHLVGLGGRLALLGTGDPALEQELHRAAARHPGRMGVHIGYDEAQAHRLLGGGDVILVPSRFEPCGLTQLYGLAYGCIPLVAHTGGLADTVIDANLAALAAGCATGIQFHGVEYAALAQAIRRTVTLYWQGTLWGAIQRAAMKSNFSWRRSGEAYAQLYAKLMEQQ